MRLDRKRDIERVAAQHAHNLCPHVREDLVREDVLMPPAGKSRTFVTDTARRVGSWVFGESSRIVMETLSLVPFASHCQRKPFSYMPMLGSSGSKQRSSAFSPASGGRHIFLSSWGPPPQ